jgi:Domain of unknown function (DUF1963)
LPLSHDDPMLAARLEGLGLSRHARELAPHATAVVRLVPTEKESSSRLGGAAILPPDVEWPAHRFSHEEIDTWPSWAREELEQARANGMVVDEPDHVALPLRYLGVLDFAALAAVAATVPCPVDRHFPVTGLLSLFLSSATSLADDVLPHRVAAAAILAPSRAPVTHRQHPRQPEPALDGVLHLVPERSVVFEPDAWNAMHEVGWSDDELLRLSKASSDDESGHYVLPLPSKEAAGGTLVPPDGHTALLRIAEVAAIGLFIGDASWVTWVITDEDLRAGRFDRLRATMFAG